MQQYTDNQLAIRLWDTEDVKDLLARRAYYISGDRREDELNDLWVRSYYNRLSASFGSNWGYHVGMDAIRKFYVLEHDARRQQQLKAYMDSVNRTVQNNFSINYGNCIHHTINTGHIHIAADGKTARALFYDMSLDAVGKPDSTCDSYVNLSPVAVDCIKEDLGGKAVWKIWHLFVGYDHCMPLGEDYSEIPPVRPNGTHPYESDFGTPTIAMKTYDPDYGWSDQYPPPPQPYDTFNQLGSYGPEGHPNYAKVRRGLI